MPRNSHSCGMRVWVTGASGFIGRALSEHLRGRGHEVVPLARKGSDPKNPMWKLPEREVADAVVHLAGENIAQRWTKEAKVRIYQSRVHGTRWLSEALAKMEKRPRTLICASGSAYYGSRGDEVLDEDSKPGMGFLVRLTQEWEAAAEAARTVGMRVVHMRIGLVLDAKGGALAKMLPVFRARLGGKLGDGKHYWSWIALPDMIEATGFLLEKSDVFGPVNLGGPAPVTNVQFTKALGTVLHRPTFFTAPRFALRLMAGEMADEVLMASIRMLPKRLQDAGFQFKHPELKEAFEFLFNHADA
ncbi:MAG TPA: TIGR01777 family oxidoreductase [Candidatus Eisenbacteria bacterium]|nr:TIGR01777 family oxidoreductase [Candidatus Eisenbacteria bacterium]